MDWQIACVDPVEWQQNLSSLTPGSVELGHLIVKNDKMSIVCGVVVRIFRHIVLLGGR